jgi:hypothetical protein
MKTNQFAVNANDYSLTSDSAATAGTIFSVDHTLGVSITKNRTQKRTSRTNTYRSLLQNDKERDSQCFG